MSDLSIDQAIDENIDRDGSPERSHGKLIIGGLIFIVLTLAIFGYQFYRIRAGDAIPKLSQLRWGYLILILCFVPIEPFVLGLRMWVVCRVLQPGISFWTCCKADLANSGIALLTPSQSGGGIGQIYILSRGGGRLATALTTTLLTFLGTMLALLAFGLYSVFVSGIGQTGHLFMGAVTTLALISAFMLFFALFPDLFRMGIAFASRWIWRLRGKQYPLQDWWPPGHSRTGSPVDRMDAVCGNLAGLVYTYRDDLRRYFRRGKTSFVIVCLLSLAFLGSRFFLAYFCLRFLGIQGSNVGAIFEMQIALIFLTYLSPTPGNAGFAEGASSWIMGEIVSLGFAPFYNLLWRFSTVYITAAAGLLILAHRIITDMQKNLPRWHLH
jgi:glycosyltransferase 2 family protein